MTTATTSRYTAEYRNIGTALPGQTLPWLQQLRTDALVAIFRAWLSIAA